MEARHEISILAYTPDPHGGKVLQHATRIDIARYVGLDTIQIPACHGITFKRAPSLSLAPNPGASKPLRRFWCGIYASARRDNFSGVTSQKHPRRRLEHRQRAPHAPDESVHRCKVRLKATGHDVRRHVSAFLFVSNACAGANEAKIHLFECARAVPTLIGLG